MSSVCTVKLPVLWLQQPGGTSGISYCSQRRQSNGSEGNTVVLPVQSQRVLLGVPLTHKTSSFKTLFGSHEESRWGFSWVFALLNSPFSVGTRCMQECPPNLGRSLCQIFLNEKVLIIFSISALGEKAAFLVLVASLTCQTATCWACQVGGLGPPSLFFLFPLHVWCCDMLFGRWLKQPELPGNRHTPVCLSACWAWEDSTPPSPLLSTSLFNLSNGCKDLFLPLARLLLTVRNRRDCLLLPFATQVIEIFISPGRTAGCYFCFIQFVSCVNSHGPWRGGKDLQPHLFHSLASDTLFVTNGKFCTGTVCVLLYWQKKTVIDIPTHALPLQERLEIGSEGMLGAAFKFCSFFNHG